MNATTTKDKSSWEGCTTKQQSILILRKRKFLLLLNIPSLPYSMLGYNRTITCTTLTFCSTLSQGRREEGEKGVTKQFLSNMLMIVGMSMIL